MPITKIKIILTKLKFSCLCAPPVFIAALVLRPAVDGTEQQRLKCFCVRLEGVALSVVGANIKTTFYTAVAFYNFSPASSYNDRSIIVQTMNVSVLRRELLLRLHCLSVDSPDELTVSELWLWRDQNTAKLGHSTDVSSFPTLICV